MRTIPESGPGAAPYQPANLLHSRADEMPWMSIAERIRPLKRHVHRPTVAIGFGLVIGFNLVTIAIRDHFPTLRSPTLPEAMLLLRGSEPRDDLDGMSLLAEELNDLVYLPYQNWMNTCHVVQ